MNVYVDLFMSFARIGAFTFGGGYAMLPMIQKEIVEKHKWATDEEVMDYFAVAQCTPGVIAVNSATFVGTKVKGVLGGAAATLGVIFPAIVIISVIAMVLQSFADIPAVQHAFNGIRADSQCGHQAVEVQRQEAAAHHYLRRGAGTDAAV